MLKSIKSLVFLSFVIVGVSLLLVIFLGFRQYRLSNQYGEISALSERALFGFNTIREQVTEQLIGGDYGRIKASIPDIEQLNNTISQLYDLKVIPAQYKLAMADSIDLSNLVIGLRKLESADDKVAAGLAVQQELRSIGGNLMKVDRIITGQIRDSVIGFQLSVIGTMGVLISCASFILIVLYKKAVRPLLALSEQTGQNQETQRSFQCSSEAGSEILVFVDSVNRMLEKSTLEAELIKQARPDNVDLLSTTVNETTNGLNAVINYAELLLESDSDQLSEQQREMLTRIVENGERIGEQWQNISRSFNSSDRG
jgi:signal transduction histidine kinase